MPIKYFRKCKNCERKYEGFGKFFCSQSCRTFYLWKNHTYKGHPSWLKGTKGIAKPNKGSFKKGNNVGKEHPNWKGGKRITESGYVRVWVGPKKWVYEHRLVMAQHLGRNLGRKEHIHHLNRNKADNKIENLCLLSHSKHNSIHATEQWKVNLLH